MAKSSWTLVVLPDDREPVRQYRISRRLARSAAWGFVLLLLLAAASAAALFVRESYRFRAQRLEREKEALAAELARLRDDLGELRAQLADLSEKDERYRLLAGLFGIDEEVLEVGIGGPGLPTPEENPLWGLDSTLSRETFALSYDLSVLKRKARLLAESLAEATDSLEAHRDLLESTPSIFPAAGLLTSRFAKARLHPILNRKLPHEGIDIAAPEGTPILAAAKGRVSFVGWRPGYGRMVEIDHGYGYRTRYAHASRILVRWNQRVERGQVIALVGRSGLVTAPSLHYEVLVGGRPRDPMGYVIRNVLPE